MTKKVMGRPKKFKKEYCKMLEEHMTQAYSYESFAAKIGVTRDCLYKWEKSHPNFLYSKKKGKDSELLRMEQIGFQGMTGKLKGFNSTVWIFMMKNKCGWTDKVEQEIAVKDISINIDKNDANL